MFTIRRTRDYADWIKKLKDFRAQARIADRIDRLAAGNPGDVKPVGEGVSELRVNYGPGYRVYFIREGSVVYVLLCGGDKSSQDKDIRLAKRLAQQLKE
ncbi:MULTISPECIES: type II toxin-antitoxin system RelE/ParE family toxin [unclassified Rhizobium]|uniref:type II toxin-antitoxin system RelE/ParE family toxin n=1 Tax=unclassified Rhizobium TaxID=2613769 RepID=UPI00071373CB|nr:MULTISPECIES: type II toxin-antitoxin system RelE/ParE family toxin [unclassified Rhizobium]KQS99299.1 addiction module antitoxin RelB [Rhizobium sp. Leaf391]KQT05054.1 addiction module antitoxin RelB [Rhizobium sp. Leaf386]KQU06068.1 addiction module antitoxin RelB [Rhizobium sp. Leaf453]